MITIDDIKKILGAPACGKLNISSKVVDSFCTDSRNVAINQVFVAIKGQSFNGNDFIDEVAKKGALAVICEKKNPLIDVLQWEVKDSIEALGKIAAFYRKQYKCPIIALTGSNGKTTVKEMIASMLPKPSLSTKGNFNNHLGVPLSVLSLSDTHRYAVFELGANHKNEISYTVNIVKPKVALINNIAPAHIEGFGSINGVADAKGEIYDGLDALGTAIVNDDDVYSHYFDKKLKNKKQIRFSITKKSDVYAENIFFNDAGCASFDVITSKEKAHLALKVPGIHNVSNALAAISCILALDLNVELSKLISPLEAFGGVKGRMTYYKGKNDSLIIDDTYNANLRSTLSAIEVLANRVGERIFVFGDMGELGDFSKIHHQEVGEFARKKNIDKILTCGLESKWTSVAFGNKAKHYETKEDLVNDLVVKLNKNTTVLVKGSRSSAMEDVVRCLEACSK